MPLNRRSRLITQGVARSFNRAMLRAVGFGDGDFEKPKPRCTTGALAKYIKRVSTASRGAITE